MKKVTRFKNPYSNLQDFHDAQQKFNSGKFKTRKELLEFIHFQLVMNDSLVEDVKLLGKSSDNLHESLRYVGLMSIRFYLFLYFMFMTLIFRNEVLWLLSLLWGVVTDYFGLISQASIDKKIDMIHEPLGLILTLLFTHVLFNPSFMSKIAKVKRLIFP